ncbi:UdgX family uracil-DNA binding protein [Subtercola boreus]|uniref:UdgX family uracil-DNA binding protein n=1 Tax=Subtercola boreus TaxID=120213 RepID=UPI00263A605A|nr:UdgX family uracil-DNA binding protein [Subtercola boreus]
MRKGVEQSGAVRNSRSMSEQIERPGAAAWVPARADAGRLRAAAAECRGCELWHDATQVVFSAGPASAPLMLVGEQPGDREDLEGRPFVGPAGRLLADAVTEAGIDRKSLYVTNAVKHFRFEERGQRRIHKTPGVGHVVACHPWLEAEVAAVAPQVILCLGATAARSVLGRPASVTKERGRVLDAPAALGPGVKVLVTNHPSAVLRMRGEAGFDDALAGLVADLRLAASHVGE